MISDEERAAEEYYKRIMTPDDVLNLKDLVAKIGRVPSPAREYLQRRCRDVSELEEFFKDREHLFFVDNQKVALSCEGLDLARTQALSYFERVLQEEDSPVDFKALKLHIDDDDAPANVGRYIRSFYPGKQFKKFLKGAPGVFSLHKDSTVFLIERESAFYFRNRLRDFGANGVPFNHFRGHVTQAPPKIQSYINQHYPGNHFQIFLLRNSNVFHLDSNGLVTLVPPE